MIDSYQSYPILGQQHKLPEKNDKTSLQLQKTMGKINSSPKTPPFNCKKPWKKSTSSPKILKPLPLQKTKNKKNQKKNKKPRKTKFPPKKPKQKPAASAEAAQAAATSPEHAEEGRQTGEELQTEMPRRLEEA